MIYQDLLLLRLSMSNSYQDSTTAPLSSRFWLDKKTVPLCLNVSLMSISVFRNQILMLTDTVLVWCTKKLFKHITLIVSFARFQVCSAFFFKLDFMATNQVGLRQWYGLCSSASRMVNGHSPAMWIACDVGVREGIKKNSFIWTLS